MKRIIGVIPARFASQRFPGKPLVKIKGQTLIERTYANAAQCTALDDLVVATDDQRIYDHVLSFGGKVAMTSTNCQNGTERIAELLTSSSDWSTATHIVNIQGDEPLLEPEVIDKVVAALLSHPKCVMSTAAMKISTEAEALSSNVVKCVFDTNHRALYFSRSLIPAGHLKEFDTEATYYKHIGIYGYQKDFLLHYPSLKETPLQIKEDLEQLKVLEHGYEIQVALVSSQSIGIDTPEELELMELRL